MNGLRASDGGCTGMWEIQMTCTNENASAQMKTNEIMNADFLRKAIAAARGGGAFIWSGQNCMLFHGILQKMQLYLVRGLPDATLSGRWDSSVRFKIFKNATLSGPDATLSGLDATLSGIGR